MATGTLESPGLDDLEQNLRVHVWTLMKAGFVEAAVCLIQAEAIVAAHALVYGREEEQAADGGEEEQVADGGDVAEEGSPDEAGAESPAPDEAEGAADESAKEDADTVTTG